MSKEYGKYDDKTIRAAEAAAEAAPKKQRCNSLAMGCITVQNPTALLVWKYVRDSSQALPTDAKIGDKALIADTYIFTFSDRRLWVVDEGNTEKLEKARNEKH